MMHSHAHEAASVAFEIVYRLNIESTNESHESNA
jgi:hypothetical protein